MHFELIKGEHPFDIKILLDGKELQAVISSIHLHIIPGAFPTAIVKISPRTLHIEGEDLIIDTPQGKKLLLKIEDYNEPKSS